MIKKYKIIFLVLLFIVLAGFVLFSVIRWRANESFRRSVSSEKEAIARGDDIVDYGLYAKDKTIKMIFYLGESLPWVDSDSFKFLASESYVLEHDYAKDKNGFIVEGFRSTYLNQHVDVKTFRYVGGVYFADKNYVYAETLFSILKDADPKTFYILLENYGSTYNSIGADKKNVYVGALKLDGADPKTFQVIAYDFFKDKNNIFEYGKMVEGADQNTYTRLDYGYSKDKNHVFYHGKILAGLDASFVTITWSKYASDFKFVYDGDKLINDADPETFNCPKLGLCYDKNYVYSNDNRIANSDGHTFIFLSDHYAKDKNNVYYVAEEGLGAFVLDGAHPKTFKVLQDTIDVSYGKDNLRVYINRDYMIGVNAKKFNVLSNEEQNRCFDATDGNYYFKNGGSVDLRECSDIQGGEF